MGALFTGYERCICGPTHTCKGTGDEARLQDGKLVDERKPITLFYHPLHVGRRSRHIRDTQWNPDLGKHLRQAEVRGWMQFWIAENRDSRCGFLQIDLRL